MAIQTEIDALLAENQALKQRIAELEHRYTYGTLHTLRDTLLSFVQISDWRELVRLILQQAGQMIAADGGFVNAIQPGTTDHMQTVAGFGFFEQVLDWHFGTQDGVASVAWQTGKRLLISDYDNHPNRREQVSPGMIASAVLFPLIQQNTVIGVMGLSYQDPSRRFTPELLDMLESFAQIAAMAIHNARVVEDLRHNKTLVEQIADTAQEILVVFDLETAHVAYINRAITTLLGYSKMTLLGQAWDTITDLIHPDDLAQFQDIVAGFQQGDIQRAELEIRMRDSDGEWHWFYNAYQILSYRDSQPAQVLGVMHDITEEKRTARTLAEAEARFRQLVGMLPALIFIYQDSRLTYLNAATNIFCGYTIAELNALNDILTILHPDSVPIISDTLNRFSRDKKTAGYVRVRVLAKTGDPMWVDVYATEILIDDQPALLCVGIDVTEQRNAQEHRLALTLEKERVQLLAEFIRDAGHDFRTPLATINTSLYLLQRLQDKTQQDEHIKLIKGQVGVLDKLVEALLTMTKLDSGVEMRIVPINLKRLLGELEHEITVHNRHPNIQITFNVADNIPEKIPCDRSWCYKAIKELLDNALTYARSLVTLTIRYEDDFLCIHVEDDGFGIPPSELTYIFERFYRGEISRAVGGLGLGLTIARKVVEAHGGNLSVVSELGEFSRFTLRLNVKAIVATGTEEERSFG